MWRPRAASGKAMAEAGIGLVYGGGSLGLMGEVARAVLANGGRVTGIIPVVPVATRSACCARCTS